MNPTVILALIGDLYGQIADLTARNAQLEAELLNAQQEGE